MPQAVMLMVQGVGADAGKSLVTGALCRHFVQQGLRVAPFKPVLVCKDPVSENGLLSDPRFVFSIQAARVALSRDHNPIQLRVPRRDWLGQVMSPGTLVLPSGRSYEVSLFARDTPVFSDLSVAVQREIQDTIRERLYRLSKSHDIVIIEGAGSPIDLGRDDVANFFIACEFPVRVILVTKLSAGGAAASLAGTYVLLQPEIRSRVAGYILNDCIGGTPVVAAMRTLLAMTIPVPCLGVLPNLWSVAPWVDREAELNSLAQLVEQHLDVARLTQTIGPSVG